MNDNTTTTNAQDLITKLSLAGLPKARQDEVMAQLDQLIEARVALAITEQLSEEDGDKLDAIVDTGTPEQAVDFIKQHVPDYDVMVTKISDETIEELANNKDAVLAEVERLRKEEAPNSFE